MILERKGHGLVGQLKYHKNKRDKKGKRDKRVKRRGYQNMSINSRNGIIDLILMVEC